MARESPLASSTIGVGWTGRTDLSLINERGGQAGSVAVAIGSDAVTLRYENRFLAEIPRQTLHDWLVHPRDVLQVHDVTWFVQAGLTCIGIAGLGCFVVPGSCVGQLVAVV